jgi:PAS domain S-box-containing protein
MAPASPAAGLSRRFAIVAAILTAAAMLLISIVSFWLIDRQREQANDLLQQREVAFHATTVGHNLQALSTRLADVAASPILANALIDSAGKETYLAPFLHGLRQMNGIPVQVLFTDFEGKEIADNGSTGFGGREVAWLRTRLASGIEGVTLQDGELVGVYLLRYSRTSTPEGALMYKIRLADLRPVPWAVLEGGSSAALPHRDQITAQVPLPRSLAHLGLVLREDERRLPAPLDSAAPQYLSIAGITAALALLVFLLASRLALGLTRDLRQLEAFSASLGGAGISSQRAPLAGSREVVSLAGAINRMLDRLYEQHAHLEAERRRFHQLSNNIPQLVWMANPDGNIVWFNDRWYEFAGAEPGAASDGLTNADWQKLHDPNVLPEVLRRWRKAVDAGLPDQMTFPLRGADGQYRSFYCSIAPLRDAGGRIVQWFGTCTDVSQLEQAERAVRYSEERLQQGLVAARMAVWERDPVEGTISFSANLHSVFGKRCSNANEFWELVHPDDREALHETIARAVREGSEYSATPRIRRADDGRGIWIDLRGRLGLAADGRSTVVHAVAIDITERKHAEEALQLADRRKDEFLAMLAHELRNPLAPISSAADMLRIAYSGEPRVKQISEIVARQVAHMRHLVDDLLDVSRVTRGLVAIASQPLDLRRVVGEAVEQSRPLLETRHHQLEVALPGQALMVDGDHTRLVQVVANLLNNAAKYTPEGGRIEVGLEACGGQARLTVRDNGTGIVAELLPVVFDLFTQGSRTLDRAQGGLGLGLALVRKLVELHGGEVEASSPGPGQGSSFTVSLPLI